LEQLTKKQKTSNGREAFAPAVQYKKEAFTAVASERKRNGTVVSFCRIPLRRGFAAMLGCLRCQQ